MQNFDETGGKRFYKNNPIIKLMKNVNEFHKGINLWIILRNFLWEKEKIINYFDDFLYFL